MHTHPLFFFCCTSRICLVRSFASFLRTVFDRSFCDVSADRLTLFFLFPLVPGTWCSFRLHVPFIYTPRQHPVERLSLPSNHRFIPGNSHSRPGSAHSAHRGHGNGQTQKVFVYTSPSPHGERATEIKVRVKVQRGVSVYLTGSPSSAFA